MESYLIVKDMGRMLIPQTIKTGTLCVVFFFAIKINLYLFSRYHIISMRPHAIVDLFIAAIIFLLFLIQIIITYIRTVRCRYTFYADRIEHPKWTIPYQEIRQPTVTQDRIDKIFKTGTVQFSQGRALEHIRHPEEMRDYVLRLAGMQVYAGSYSQR